MKLLVSITSALMFATVAFADFPYHSNTGSFNANTNVTASYDAFGWQWFGYDDQQISVNLAPAGYSNVMFRMSYPRKGKVFLDVTNGVMSSITNYTATILKSNLPPNGVYYSEFLAYTTTSTGTLTRTMSAGMINVQQSVYSNTNQSSWVNPIAGMVIGPPLHTLSALSGWPFLQNGSFTINGQAVVNGGSITISGGDSTDLSGCASNSVSGTYLSIASRVIGLTTYALTNGLNGIYSLATHIHDWSAITGLGSAATNETADFATALQGSKADTALQSFTESDPLWIMYSNTVAYVAQLGSAAYSDSNAFVRIDGLIYTQTVQRANSAYGWGDHSLAGYLTGEPAWGAVSNTVIAGASAGATALQPTGNGGSLTNITASQVGALSGLSVNSTTATVVNGFASVTISAGGGGVSAPNSWDIDLTWGDLAQATTNDSVGLVSGQLSGQSIYNASNTTRYASFCTALTNITTATASTAFTVPLGYGGTGGVFWVKQTQTNSQPIVFNLTDGNNKLYVTGTVSTVDTETPIPFSYPAWATNAGAVVGIQATISGASTNVANVRYWGVNRKVRLLK
jgi:hypothetical protein